MELTEMKLGDLLAIVKTIGASAPAKTEHPLVGQYVICRCASAGVHAGFLVSQNGDEALLRDSRRLWSWKTKGGIALSGLAVHGLAGGKIDSLLPMVALTGVIETIPCTATARESINAA